MINYCSKCGSNDIIAKESYKVCNSCNTEFYDNPKATVGVVLTNNNKVFLAKRNINPGKGQWAIIAGFVENTETSEKALIREIKEELTLELDADSLEYICSKNHFYTYREDTFRTLLSVFVYELSDDLIPRIKINNENSECGFFAISEVEEFYNQGFLYPDNWQIIQKV